MIAHPVRLLACALLSTLRASANNIVNLDSSTLQLLTGRGRPAFVRFGKEHDFGEKADAFNKLAQRAVGEDLLIGSVGITTYGEKQNQDLAETYGYKKPGQDLSFTDMDSTFPKFRFFPAAGADVEYSGEVTFDKMAEFLKAESQIDLLAKGDENARRSVVGRGRAERNVVSLYPSTMALLVGRDLPSFVRFDKEYSHGEKADAFKALAETLVGARLLVGTVGISAHGQKQNQELAEKYGYKQEGKDLDHSEIENIFPKFRFFPANGGRDIEYTGDVTLEAMSSFLKTEGNIYVGLQGTLQDFDKLATEFMKAENKQEVLLKAKAAVSEAPEQDRAAGEYYVRHMGFALAKGAQWFQTEHDRIKWILDNGKLIQIQRDDLTVRRNRILSFLSPHQEL